MTFIAMPTGPERRKRFLFLQGPICPYFPEVGARLRALGHEVHRINLCLGDRLSWRGPGAVDYQGTPEDWPGFVAGFLDARGITDIVLLGEKRFYHMAAIAAAKARGISVTVTDFGYLRPDWITLEHDGMGGDSRFPRDPATLLRLARGLPAPSLAPVHQDSFRQQAFWDVIYHGASLAPWTFRHYRSHQLHHPLRTYLGIGWRLLTRRREHARATRLVRALRKDGPLYLFAMQMETDFSIRAYSHYKDMDSPIAETVRSFARHAPANAHLVVKVHPLDPAVKRWPARLAAIAAAEGVPGRVHYIAGGALDPMLRIARGLVTVNSTVGLKAITLGCPTLALGQAVYDVPGLAWQGGLDRFWTKSAAPEPRLCDAYLRVMCATVLVRGVYYNRPGLDAAVEETAQRLHRGLINQPMPEGFAKAA